MKRSHSHCLQFFQTNTVFDPHQILLKVLLHQVMLCTQIQQCHDLGFVQFGHSVVIKTCLVVTLLLVQGSSYKEGIGISQLNKQRTVLT